MRKTMMEKKEKEEKEAKEEMKSSSMYLNSIRCWLMILLFANDKQDLCINPLTPDVFASCYISILAFATISSRLSLTWINLLWHSQESVILICRPLWYNEQARVAPIKENKF